jgi:DNA-binding SARP family transcriptional activator
MTLIPLELICFGSPRARLGNGDTPPELRWRKHLALLIYLALSADLRCSRDTLLALLWDTHDQGARKALNTTVNRLRAVLGAERIRSEGDALVLDDTALQVDVLTVRSHSASAPESVSPLVQGDFLEGFYVNEAPQQFQDWMATARQRYSALAFATLVAAGERLLKSDLQQAADLAHRALAILPTGEPAVRLLMRATALGGNSTGALSAYSKFAQDLATDLNEQPGRAIAEMAERIRAETWRPAGTNTTLSIPLVGRESLRREVFETIAGAVSRAHAHAIVIGGPPGMGRSRLLAECTQRLALEGLRVLQIRPVKNDQNARWSALRLLLNAGISTLRGLTGARPDALAALAGLAPELAERFAPREAKDIADMANALASVLAAGAEEQPIAIAIDDAHWADGASVAALGAAMCQLKSSAVHLLITVAQDRSDISAELTKLESEVGRDISGLHVRLRPLENDDITRLVTAVATWCRDDQARDRLTRRISHESRGNPLYAVSLLAALAKSSQFQQDMTSWPPAGGTIDTPLPISVPVASFAVKVRLGELEPAQVRVLGVASMLGPALDIELIAQLTNLSVDKVERALSVCESRHFVQFDGLRYTFAAPLIADVVRSEAMLKGERRRLEKRAIEVVGMRTDPESRALHMELLARLAARADRRSGGSSDDVAR